jgi:hypothetical protein
VLHLTVGKRRFWGCLAKVLSQDLGKFYRANHVISCLNFQAGQLPLALYLYQCSETGSISRCGSGNDLNDQRKPVIIKQQQKYFV